MTLENCKKTILMSQIVTSNSDKISFDILKNDLNIQESISIYPNSNLNFTFAKRKFLERIPPTYENNYNRWRKT